jgi:hypothetical protein
MIVLLEQNDHEVKIKSLSTVTRARGARDAAREKPP